MSEPFKPEDVLYRFTPEDKDGIDEILVVGPSRTVYWRRGDRYEPGLLHGKVITRLLVERAASEQKEAAVKHAITDMQETLQKVEAERDVYRKTLHMYASEKSWLTAGRWADVFANGYDEARAALAEGEKIRGGK